MVKHLIILVSISLFYSSTISAERVQIRWEYPQELEYNIDGFSIFYGVTSHVTIDEPFDPSFSDPYEMIISVDDPTARTEILELPPGTYYFSVISFKDRSAGLVGSLFSDEAGIYIQDTTVKCKSRRKKNCSNVENN